MLLSDLLQTFGLELKFATRLTLGPALLPYPNSNQCSFQFNTKQDQSIASKYLSYFDQGLEQILTGIGNSQLEALEDLLVQLNQLTSGHFGFGTYRPINAENLRAITLDVKYLDQFVKLGQPAQLLPAGSIKLELSNIAPLDSIRITVVVGCEALILVKCSRSLMRKCKLKESGDKYELSGYVDTYVDLTRCSHLYSCVLTKPIYDHILKQLKDYFISTSETRRKLEEISLKMELL